MRRMMVTMTRRRRRRRRREEGGGMLATFQSAARPESPGDNVAFSVPFPYQFYIFGSLRFAFRSPRTTQTNFQIVTKTRFEKAVEHQRQVSDSARSTSHTRDQIFL
jgi:hypothetical protein